MLKDYRGRFPFKLATTSYIYPDKVVPNVVKLARYFDEIELVFFESESEDSLLSGEELKVLTDLSSRHGLRYNIHLPLDLFLGDKREAVRTRGVSVVKGMIERTFPLNPSVYTLHLESENASTPAFVGKKEERSELGGEQKGRLQEPNTEDWRSRLSRSLEEILKDGIEAGRISVETLGYPFEWVEEIVERFGLSICLDIGHLLARGQGLSTYLERYLSKTSIVHLHGYQDGVDHLGIDRLAEPALKPVLSHLHDYQGIVSLEVFSAEDLQRSLALLEEKWEKR